MSSLPEQDDVPSPEEPAAEHAKKRTAWGLARSVVAGIVKGSLLLALLIILAVLVVRLFVFNDNRLRQMAEDEGSKRLGTDVEIKALDLGLFGGIEILGVRVGPPQGFSHDTLGIERIALHYSLLDLITREVTVEELAVEGVRVTLEENELGKNIDALVKSLAGPKKPEPPAEPEKPPQPESQKRERKPLSQPNLPLRVVVEKLRFTLAEARVIRPDMEVRITHVGLDATFEGEGTAMALWLWAGLGDREPGGVPSTLDFRKHAPQQSVQSEQRFGVEVESTGLGDVRVAVRLTADTSVAGVAGDKIMPPVNVSAAIDMATNLLAESADLSRLSFALGERTQIDLVAAATEILREPRVGLKVLKIESDLAELSPFVAVFVPGSDVGGTFSMNLDPFAAEAKALSRVEALPLTLKLDIGDLRAVMPGINASGLDAAITLETLEGKATVSLDLRLKEAVQGLNRLRGLRVVADVKTPILPWMGKAPPKGWVDADLSIYLARASAKQGRMRELTFDFASRVPIGLIKKHPTPDALAAKMSLRLGSAWAPQGQARDVALDLDSKLWDLRGNRLTADMQFGFSEAKAPVGKNTAVVPGLGFSVNASRHGDAVEIASLALDVAETVGLRMKGGVAGFMGKEPRFTKLAVRLLPIDLAAAMDLVPAGMKPPMTLGGHVALDIDVDGTIPYKRLAEQAKMPKVRAPPDASKRSVAPLHAEAAEQFLLRWVSILEAGMPFDAHVLLKLADVSLIDAKNDVSGISMAAGVDLDRHGMGLYVRPTIAAVNRPMEVSDIGLDVGFRFEGGDIELTMDASVARMVLKGQPSPIEGTTFGLGVSFKPGGDLLLERMAFGVENRGLKVALDGMINKPMRIVRTRGWERAGMPGVSAALRFGVGLVAPVDLILTPNKKTVLRGALELSGSFEVRDGIAALVGQLGTEDLNMTAGNAQVVDMSGEIPFDLRLLFDRRADAAVLSRNLLFGGGVLSLVASTEDIRDRPARPVYYSRLRPYRRRSGIHVVSMKQGRHALSNIELELRIERGLLLVDWLSLHMLGGDIHGGMAVQLGSDQSVRGDIDFKLSNIDASYFPQLGLEPGPASELSADLAMGFLFAPRQRDLTLNMNITKIGTETLDRFLQLLDPEGKDTKIQKQRKNLALFKKGWLLRLDEVAVWIRYENLNMDLACTSLIGIPFTDISYMPIERELVRRFALSGFLDTYLQPAIDKSLAKPLGWARVQ